MAELIKNQQIIQTINVKRVYLMIQTAIQKIVILMYEIDNKYNTFNSFMMMWI